MTMNEFPSIQMNKYQTPLTPELLANYPEEVVEELFDVINNVEYVKRLIAPDRKRAKDLPRDEKGRIIVDLANPHILEDMDYFRQPAIDYLKHHCYTFLQPDARKESPYKKFWREEKRRCRDGYVRESDGEWVPGMLYWFLNYNPMVINQIQEGSTKAIRDGEDKFPLMWEGIYLRGHYLWQAREHGKHAIELARRGCGKSYYLSSIMTHNLILGEDSQSKKRVTTVLTAYEKEYLSPEKDGTMSKFVPSLNFIRANTAFPRLLLKNAPGDMTWQMGYEDEFKIQRGSFNLVLGVSAKDNPDKLRGKRGWILFEEMGTFKGLLPLYDTTRHSVEDGDYTFACMYLVGTSSEKEADFSSAKTLLYSPEGYKIYAIENVYDRPSQGRPQFGYFFPAYVNRLGCYNKDGVSDVTKALLQVLYNRWQKKYSADPKSVLKAIAEDPITPAEAIIKVKAAYFPVAQINERILQLDSDPNIYHDTYIGALAIDNTGNVVFRPTNDEPIRKWGVDNDTPGALEIFEMPEKDSRGKVFTGRYIIGHDPVDNDQAESSSLSSTFVLDLFTDSIVAEFTGRKQFADDNFEIVRLLAMFYNAQVLYESNKKGLYAYFAKMSSTHLLAETPQYLRDQQLVKYSPFGSNKYGVNASAAINNYANGLIKDWLMTPVPIVLKNEEGEDVETSLPQLYKIRNRALLDELVNFTPEVNVDRIRALGMVMLLRQDKIILYQGDMSRARQDDDINDLANDEFFRVNYDERFKLPTEEDFAM